MRFSRHARPDIKAVPRPIVGNQLNGSLARTLNEANEFIGLDGRAVDEREVEILGVAITWEPAFSKSGSALECQVIAEAGSGRDSGQKVAEDVVLDNCVMQETAFSLGSR